MEPGAYIDSLVRSSAALAGAGRANIEAGIPSCPGWTVADVIGHVGGVHRWAAAAVRTAERGRFSPPPEGMSGEELVAWGEQGADEIVAALRAADPDADVWTFGLPRSVRFWLRRQAHETAVHAWDATDAVGSPLTLDPDMSADGVDEFLVTLIPRWLGRQPGTWAGESFHVHRTDGAGEWLVTLGPAGEATVDRTHAKGDVALRGPAVELLLWATNRRPADALEVIGDRSLAARWAAEIQF